jgi:hypothetical protein
MFITHESPCIISICDSIINPFIHAVYCEPVAVAPLALTRKISAYLPHLIYMVLKAKSCISLKIVNSLVYVGDGEGAVCFL